MSKTLFLIDGHSYIYQSFFGMPPLTNAEGKQVQAVYAMSQLLLRLHDELAPDAWAVCMDAPGPTFRHERFAEYKAHREAMPDELRAQLPWIDEVFGGFRIPVLRIPGFEADDVIATLARRAVADGYDVRIVSRDKDLEQLLSDRVRVWDPKNGAEYGPEELAARRGGLSPDRVIEYLALVGDSSDNVPGVAGVGPKTALKVLEATTDVEQLLDDDAPETIPAAALKKIRAQAEEFRLSRQLVRLDDRVPLDDAAVESEALRLRDLDADMLRPAWQRHGFQKFMPRLEAPDVSGAPRATVERGDHRLLKRPEDLAAIIHRARNQGHLAMRAESADAEAAFGSPLAAVALSVVPGVTWTVPLATGEPLDPGLRRLLEDASVGKRGHDLKRSAHALRSTGVRLAGLADDGLIAAYLINSTRRSYSLVALGAELLGHDLPGLTDALGSGRDRLQLDQLQGPALAAAIGEELHIAERTLELLGPQLDEGGLRSVYEELELPLIDVLVDMEREGLTLDDLRLQELENSVAESVRRLERQIHELVGESFNINSPKQLASILFDKLGLTSTRKTKTGLSTSAAVLEELAEAHPENPLPRAILDYRSHAKLLSTYIQALPKLVRRDTGRIHTVFSQVAAATGRLASSEPNLQNIPVRTDLGRQIRRAFIPNRDGDVFLSADYSQIELRMLAHIADADELRQHLAGGADIHRSVAARIFGIALDAVTREQRNAAKAVNFGVIYGMGPFRLARDLTISFAEAKEFIARFFEVFPGVRRFIDDTIAGARESGEVRTILGRRRPIADLHARLPHRRQRAEREAVNTVIQGSAADLIKRAMIVNHQRLQGSDGAVRLLLQIHDELLFEVPRDRVAEETARVTQEMETVMELTVPLVVQVSSGVDWYDASK